MSLFGQREDEEVFEDDATAIDPRSATLLDQAADYEYRFHHGAQQIRGARPGRLLVDRVPRRPQDVRGGNTVLNGLDVGIPEGMITVVLGPSGTGKSRAHQAPDRAAVPRPGRDHRPRRVGVADDAESELLEVRRKFGILFQDGALFGSMNLYDNVAFPLRQHTDLTEAQIARHRRRSASPRSA